MIGETFDRNSKQTEQILSGILLVGYLAAVLWYTVLARSIEFRDVKMELFWSYREWLHGNKAIGFQIVGNVALFIPCGYFISSAKPQWGWISHITMAILCSWCIEVLQLLARRGYCELDDLLNNSIGAGIGCALNIKLRGVRYTRFVSTIIGLIGIIVVIVACVTTPESNDNIPSVLCFQIDKLHGNTATGTAFLLERDSPVKLQFFLQSTRTGERIKLTTEEGLKNNSVGDYFGGDFDYYYTKFNANISERDYTQEYEFVLSPNPLLYLPTGVYITGDQIHYVSDLVFEELENKGKDLQEIIQEATLRVYRPEFKFYVYQKENRLYWIVDEGFDFDKDGSTLIQYQLWTTNKQKLPANRIEKGYLWDNCSANFEDYELQGDFGNYRVCCREIPDAYPISYIVTGYYYNNWVWREYFRPIYTFKTEIIDM